MKMLSKAVSSKLDNYVAPKRGEGFEDLCLDIFEHVLSKRGLPIIGGSYTRIVAHGVSGDSQGGVDIYDPATLAAAQCKNQASFSSTHIEQELRKLQDFDKPVSHYFFLLGRDGVPKSLQNWVEKANQRRAHAHFDESGTVFDFGGSRPMLHIMGWQELKTYLFESNFLMWKWGVSHPVIQQYPYLPTLDVNFLAESMAALKNKLDVLPNRRASKDAVEGLLRSVDVDGLVNLVADGKVEGEVFVGLEYFIQTFKQALGVAKTYAVAVKDVDSQDPIIMEQGFALMNDLARHLPRISVLMYLRTVYRASKELLNVFSDEDSYAWARVVVDYQGQEVEVEGDTTLLFNFEHEDWTSPYCVDPGQVGGLIRDIVEGVMRARQEISDV
ncbi:hypothetical protein [Pseudomonas moorei]|uniref:hypothetical protein n=1 Tax=Pseudomonas moorei TaxID=395599 RepID=UPI00200F99F8|nr:hypothetical protein [Pseudomonas moorei]